MKQIQENKILYEVSGKNCNEVSREAPKSFLPFHKPWIGEEEKKELLDTLESGWLTKGPKTKAFEKQFAEFIGVPYAIATNSCTSALHLALVGIGIKPGDEIITTPITFAATVNVIEQCGAKPVFVDVEEDTLNINPELIEGVVSPKTKAIIPVHFAGQMCRMDQIRDIAQKYNMQIIEDAAHATEAVYLGKPPGHWSKMAAFSFYPTKNITTGEGGMLVTNDCNLAERLEILSVHGLSKDAWKRYGKDGSPHWEVLEAGFKYHMSDLQASLGIHQLKKIDLFWKKRKDLVDVYNKELEHLEGINPLKIYSYGKHAHHLYVVRIDSKTLGITRDEFICCLQKKGIGAGIHFSAIHTHPYYKEKYKVPLGTFPVAEKAGDEVLSLPLYPLMSLEDATFVVKATKKILRGKYF